MREAGTNQAVLRRLRSFEKRQFLKPMQISEILDVSIQIYRRTSWKLLSKTFIPSLWLSLGFGFFDTFISPMIFKTRFTENQSAQVIETTIGVLVFLAAVVPLGFVGFAVATQPCVKVASALIMGDDVPPDDNLIDPKLSPKLAWSMVKALFQCSWILLITIVLMLTIGLLSPLGESVEAINMVITLFVVGGFMASLVVVPAIGSAVAMVPTITILEGKDGKAAFARSKFLSKKHGRTDHIFSNYFATWFVVGFFFLLIGLGFELALSMIGVERFIDSYFGIGLMAELSKSVVGVLPLHLAVWVLIPFYSIISTVIYYDRRVRIEALDIRVLAEDVLNVEKTSLR